MLPHPESVSAFAPNSRPAFAGFSMPIQAATGLFGSVFCRPKARLFPVDIQRVSIAGSAADKVLPGD